MQNTSLLQNAGLLRNTGFTPDPRKFSGSEWTLDDLLAIERVCSRHAANYALDTFPNQMEVITSEQMLDSYISAGLPVNYAHWSFGKHFLI
jgi:stage V sporulation protein R